MTTSGSEFDTNKIPMHRKKRKTAGLNLAACELRCSIEREEIIIDEISLEP